MEFGENILAEVGLSGVPEGLKPKLIELMYDQLEMRVGERLLRLMPEALADQCLQAIEDGDESKAMALMQAGVPGFRGVVAESLDELKQEWSEGSPIVIRALLENGRGVDGQQARVSSARDA